MQRPFGNRIMLKVAIKFCGGCNPDYDRAAIVKHIKQSLNEKVEFVSLEDKNIDLVLTVEGCKTACADLNAIKATQIRIINNIDDAVDFLQNFKT
jgi:hypothetical protein